MANGEKLEIVADFLCLSSKITVENDCSYEIRRCLLLSKERQTLNDTMDRLDLIDIYRTFHPKTINFTFFSSAHGTFSRIDHILGHKSSLGKLKKNWYHLKHLLWSQCSKIRCQLQDKKFKSIKNTNIWRLNNTFLNNQQIIEEIKKDIKICIEMNENENTTTKTCGTL